MLNSTQAQSLIKGITRASALSSLYTGRPADPLLAMSSVLNGGKINGGNTLYQSKPSTLAALKTYVTENVGDKRTSAKLISDITVIENLFMMNRKDNDTANPIFGMVTGNATSFSKLPSGSILDQLL